MEEIVNKYNINLLKTINRDNFYKIINFLEKENCSFIEDIVSDYFDVFSIEYDLFIEKYNKLNQNYNGKYLMLVNEDMELLEQLFD